jgi:NADPH:quinone reductase-like Zn-dependent oxidoreductase
MMMTTTQAGARTMTAVVHEVYGATEDVLSVGRLPVPVAGEGEVLVRVGAAGVDRGVWHLMAGEPYAVRLAGFGVRKPKYPVRGSEFAGVVEAIGSGVTNVRTGDEVFGIGTGSFAEFVVAPERKVAAMPAGLTFEQASAVPVSGSTALQAVRDRGRVERGNRVLVIGASGGVGTFAVQIAKARGAEVTGVSSAGKVALVRSLGADSVIDYTAEAIPEDGRYDVVLDIGGNRPLRQLRRMLSPRGTLVIVGGEDGGRWLGVGRQLRAMALSPFVRQRLGTFINSENAADLVVLTELIESGAVRPVVDRTFPLADAPEAVGYMRRGLAKGKVVVTVGPGGRVSR